MTQVQTNSASIQQFGIQAFNHEKAGRKSLDKAFAYGVLALMRASEEMTFRCRVEYKDSVEYIDFTLGEYFNQRDVKNEAGTGRDNKATTARSVEIISKVFGKSADAHEFWTSKESASFRNSFNMWCDVVRDLRARNLTSQDLDISAQGFLKVPFEILHKAPAADASEGDIEAYKRGVGTKEILDRKSGRSVENFKRAIAPPRKPQAKTDDHGQEFLKSAKHMLAIVTEWNKADGESNVAPSKEINEILIQLHAALGGHFAAEKKDKQSQADKNTRASKG